MLTRSFCSSSLTFTMASVATEKNAVTEDGRQQNRMEAYTKFWQEDMNKEKDVDTSNRLGSYTEVVNGAQSQHVYLLRSHHDRVLYTRLL